MCTRLVLVALWFSIEANLCRRKARTRLALAAFRFPSSWSLASLAMHACICHVPVPQRQALQHAHHVPVASLCFLGFRLQT